MSCTSSVASRAIVLSGTGMPATVVVIVLMPRTIRAPGAVRESCRGTVDRDRRSEAPRGLAGAPPAPRGQGRGRRGRQRSGGGNRPAAGVALGGGQRRDRARRGRRIPAAENGAHEIDARPARRGTGGDAHIADGAVHAAWSPCMAITVSLGASSSNNEERTTERPGRSDR